MNKITIERAVLEQALDALVQRYSDLLYDYAGPHHAMAFEESIAALREALAQQSSRQVEEIPSTVLEQPQLVPVYQYQYANGSWADQTKESYDYNVRNGWATVRVLFTSLQAAPPEPQPEHPQPDRQSVPESLSDYELSELAHSANQEALSYGLSHDVFMRYFKTLRDKALAAAPQPQPVQEPYAWHYTNNGGVSVWHIGPSSRLAADIKAAREFPKVHRIVALYTYPQEAHPLSDEFLRKMHHEDQFGLFCDYDDFEQIVRAIEQAHGITKGTT